MIKNKIYFLLALLFLWGCSTKKNTWLSRNYHNLTAHYNVFFNGNESLKEGIKAIQKSNKDDYTQILPLFPDSKEANKSVAESQMDRAIQKGSKLVKTHSIRKKPKKRSGDQSLKYQKFLNQNEFNKWVDNAYLMIGKAHFYKHEYYLAQQSFAFMFREFQPGSEWAEAEIYNARAAIELEDYAKAKLLLDNYGIEGKAPEGLYGLFAATYADYYLRQKKYAEAVPFLQDAINGVWSKYYRLRFTFVLAQVYHVLDRYQEASEAYKDVIRLNPPYEMAFNAKVNRASVMFGEGGLAAVQKEIKKLLRDKRNKEYEDQIYYALAMAYKAEQQEKPAIDNLLTSVEKSTNNNYQKGLSFYELANIYYQRPEYRPSYYYLDSAMTNLDETFADYDSIADLHESLQDLVTHINTVEREDSLQRIAKMPESEMMAYINQLIEAEKDRQKEEKQQQQLASQGDFYMNNSYSQVNNQEQGGQWYFYNMNSVGMGKLEFEKRWGRRKLEDNWRRANKEVVLEEVMMPGEPGNPDMAFPKNGSEDNDSIQQEDSGLQAIIDAKDNNPLSANTYLKELPLTEDAIQKSDDAIEESLVLMGIIYKDELQNIPLAIEVFNQVLTRFHDSKYLEDVLMNLYLCYEIQDDNMGMQRIRNMLVSKFPDGEFTAFLNDPDFFKKREAKIQEVERLYEQAYTNYLFNDFVTPVENYKRAKEIDEENRLIPKFKFLAGLSYAKSGDLTGFVSELTEVKDDYPDSDVTPVAIKMLNLYNQGRTPVKGPVSSNLIDVRSKELALENQKSGIVDALVAVPTSYIVDNKSPHSLILLVNKEADLNRLKFNIADYNFSKFLLKDYEMKSSKLPDGSPVFEVNGFNNRIEALDYYYSLREREDIFEVDNIQYYQLYVIHNKNLEFLLSSGDKIGYEEFFKENYLSADAFKKEPESIHIEKVKTKTETDSSVIREMKITTEKKPEEETVQSKETPNAAAEDLTRDSIVSEPIEKEVVSPVPVESGTDVVPEEKKPLVEFIKKDGPHSALILFRKGRINIQRTGTVFTNYTKSVKDKNLEVEYGAKGMGYLYVKVKGFESAAEAKEYLNVVKADSFLMREIGRMQPYLWAITEDNFFRLKNEDTYPVYQNFYNANY